MPAIGHVGKIIYPNPVAADRAMDRLNRYFREAANCHSDWLNDYWGEHEPRTIRRKIREHYPRVYDFCVRSNMRFAADLIGFIGGDDAGGRPQINNNGKYISIIHWTRTGYIRWEILIDYLARQTGAIRAGYICTAGDLSVLVKTKTVEPLPDMEDEPEGENEYTVPPEEERPEPDPPAPSVSIPTGLPERQRLSSTQLTTARNALSNNILGSANADEPPWNAPEEDHLEEPREHEF